MNCVFIAGLLYFEICVLVVIDWEKSVTTLELKLILQTFKVYQVLVKTIIVNIKLRRSNRFGHYPFEISRWTPLNLLNLDLHALLQNFHRIFIFYLGRVQTEWQYLKPYRKVRILFRFRQIDRLLVSIILFRSMFHNCSLRDWAWVRHQRINGWISSFLNYKVQKCKI